MTKEAHIQKAIERLRDLIESPYSELYRRKYANDENWVEPSLILLDINLPGVDGIDILKKVKKTDRLTLVLQSDNIFNV